jgi:subtilase family serine protease
MMFGAWNTVQAQQSIQLLHNHVPPAVSSGQAAQVGLLPASQGMNMSIVLPLRNQSELTSLLQRLDDPTSPDYHHFLSVEQFTEQFGPTAEDYQAVVSFAQANGFSVTGTPANRLIVPLNGTVAQIDAAFNLTAAVSAGSTPLTTGQVEFCDATAAFCGDIHLLGTAQLTSARTAILKFIPGMGQ